ncbi:ABC transporter permease [Arthrobacter caoxuetaonis]|uniref:ABC transporter permease n=1 Tax=Arthrobacter caoxuetaonis TaxID=2886935 RepID=A0A9X1MC12_9MICC|nr:ABC transporter permease [Arthrobacter caoxuetaonis]MCC3297158.1 ABC transporter permease [Arthrobacter caoxuetaonis]USQ58282.1 ABC transporter permease [Arthrobacter caoxuetaonis]
MEPPRLDPGLTPVPGFEAVSRPVRRRRRLHDLRLIVLRRLGLGVPVAAGVSLLVFLLASVSPFDPLAAYLGDRFAQTSAEQREMLSESLGLGASWIQAWWHWLTSALSGDLGYSRVFRQPVASVIAERLPWTLLVAGTGLVLAALGSLLIASHCARRPGGVLDRTAAAAATLLQGLPPFVISLGLLAVFALGLGLLPGGGLSDPGTEPTAGQVLRHMILPVAATALSQLPWLVLSLRASTNEALASDAVRGARLRGLSEKTVIRKHVMPSALVPFIAVLGSRLPEVIVGAVLVETVFSWPGLAAAVVSSAQALDFALLAALTVLTTVTVLAGSLIADLLYVCIDPRVSADV